MYIGKEMLELKTVCQVAFATDWWKTNDIKSIFSESQYVLQRFEVWGACTEKKELNPEFWISN